MEEYNKISRTYIQILSATNSATKSVTKSETKSE